MGVDAAFESWRQKKKEEDWGLAWFLAYQFCRRFYISHGIVPNVIDHEGLGYYGIRLDSLPCQVNGTKMTQHGRLTMAGNVENWRARSPEDHSLETTDLCARGTPTEDIVQRAIFHLRFSALPVKSHLGCRHHRWGASYVMLFEVASILALTYSYNVLICNGFFHTQRVIERIDPLAKMKHHPGAFIFKNGDKEYVVAGDGRVLTDPTDNLWNQYMNGTSVITISQNIAQHISL